jgi:hypothetical protein
MVVSEQPVTLTYEEVTHDSLYVENERVNGVRYIGNVTVNRDEPSGQLVRTAWFQDVYPHLQQLKLGEQYSFAYKGNTITAIYTGKTNLAGGSSVPYLFVRERQQRTDVELLRIVSDAQMTATERTTNTNTPPADSDNIVDEYLFVEWDSNAHAMQLIYTEQPSAF